MGKGFRPLMLGEEIRKLVSNMLVFGELKDPAFKRMVSISGVDVSGDSSYATLYVTALSLDPSKDLTEDEKKEIISAFEKSKGFIRSNIAKNIKLRYAPELIFKFDESFEYGAKMDKLISDLNIKPDNQQDKNGN